MKALLSKTYRFLKSEDGATAIEYGLIAAGIAVAIIGIVFALGSELNNFFAMIQGQIAARY